MTTKYTVDGEWLVMNGERVMWVEGADAKKMEAIRAEYQAAADAPKVPMDTFMVSRPSPQAQLADADAWMPRISEDLVDALVAKKVIALEDLPLAAQDKLAQRKTLRAKIVK